VPRLQRTLSAVHYFTFGFGTMVGVGWVVLMDDWLGRGGPAGAMLGFVVGGLLLLPVARTYGRLVRCVPDAGGEVAYADGVLPPVVGFCAGWVMILAYAIVCPWEAVAAGNLLARLFPFFDAAPLYQVAGKTITLPRLIAGLVITALIAWINHRGVRLSGAFQNAGTFGLLGLVLAFSMFGLASGRPAHLEPAFANAGVAGGALSVLLMLQVVPYFMTGWESVGKGSEEAREGFDPGQFGRAMTGALLAGIVFYAGIVGVTAWVYPWREMVAEGIGSEQAFSRALGTPLAGQLVVLAAFVSLLKIFNGNFLAATRLAFALGRRGLAPGGLGSVHARFGTPHVAVAFMAIVTAAASFLGDAVLVPVSEVGSLAAGLGWLSACVAFLRRREPGGRVTALAGATVASAIVLMKVVPFVPGSFGAGEWTVFALWCGLGALLWARRRRASTSP
jgi:amino acid transporter